MEYRIERASIPTYPGCSEARWFLDRVWTENGHLASSNITSGSEDHCLDVRNVLIAEGPVVLLPDGTEFEIHTYLR